MPILMQSVLLMTVVLQTSGDLISRYGLDFYLIFSSITDTRSPENDDNDSTVGLITGMYKYFP